MSFFSETSPWKDENGFNLAFHGAEFFAVNGEYVYVSNSGNNTITRLKVKLATDPLVVVASEDNWATNLDEPCGLCIHDGFLYVANRGDNTIARINLATNVKTTWVSGLSSPCGLAYYDGHIIVANSGNNTVVMVNMSTLAKSNFMTGMNKPAGLLVKHASAQTNDAYLYVVNQGATGAPGSVVRKWFKDFTFSTLMSNLNFPFGIAAKGDNIYVTNNPVNTANGSVSSQIINVTTKEMLAVDEKMSVPMAGLLCYDNTIYVAQGASVGYLSTLTYDFSLAELNASRVTLENTDARAVYRESARLMEGGHISTTTTVLKVKRRRGRVVHTVVVEAVVTLQNLRTLLVRFVYASMNTDALTSPVTAVANASSGFPRPPTVHLAPAAGRRLVLRF
jgi:YVTN family beta-propeller protein